METDTLPCCPLVFSETRTCQKSSYSEGKILPFWFLYTYSPFPCIWRDTHLRKASKITSFLVPNMADEEFEEEEVWSFEVSPMEKRRATEFSTLFSSSVSSSFSNSSSKKMREIQRSSTSHVEDHGRSEHRQYSAPINIPDCSKFYGHNGDDNHRVADNGDDDDEDKDGRVPPHEWLAKKLARSQLISSFSMCEGEGRTLKGRDQRKVRDAVLTRTGFLE